MPVVLSGTVPGATVMVKPPSTMGLKIHPALLPPKTVLTGPSLGVPSVPVGSMVPDAYKQRNVGSITIRPRFANGLRKQVCGLLT